MSHRNTSPFGAQSNPNRRRNRRPRRPTFEICLKALAVYTRFIFMSRLPHPADASDEAKNTLFTQATDSYVPWAKGSYASANGTRLWARGIARVDGTEDKLQAMLDEIEKPELVRVKRGNALTTKVNGKPVPLADRQVYVLKVAGMALLLGCHPNSITPTNTKSAFAKDDLVGPQRIGTRASQELIQRIFPSAMLAEFNAEFEAAAPKAKAQNKVEDGAEVTELPTPAPADTSVKPAPAAEAC